MSIESVPANVLRSETRRQFGHDPAQLERFSKKKVVFRCLWCSRISIAGRSSGSNKQSGWPRFCGNKQMKGWIHCAASYNLSKDGAHFKVPRFIDIEATVRLHGIHPKLIAPMSKILVASRCSGCRELRTLRRDIAHGDCNVCSQMKRHKRSEPVNLPDCVLVKETCDRYGYDPRFLPDKSNLPILVRCTECHRIKVRALTSLSACKIFKEEGRFHCLTKGCKDTAYKRIMRTPEVLRLVDDPNVTASDVQFLAWLSGGSLVQTVTSSGVKKLVLRFCFDSMETGTSDTAVRLVRRRTRLLAFLKDRKYKVRRAHGGKAYRNMVQVTDEMCILRALFLIGKELVHEQKIFKEDLVKGVLSRALALPDNLRWLFVNEYFMNTTGSIDKESVALSPRVGGIRAYFGNAEVLKLFTSLLRSIGFKYTVKRTSGTNAVRVIDGEFSVSNAVIHRDKRLNVWAVTRLKTGLKTDG